MCLNIEFILRKSATHDDQLNLLTSLSHGVNDVSCAVLQTTRENVHKLQFYVSP